MISGKNTVLRAWEESDITSLHSLRNDVSLQQQLMSRPQANSIEQVRQWLKSKTTLSDSVFFVIAGKQQNKIVGYLQVVSIDLLNGTGKLGICLLPEEQGKGYGSEAIDLLQQYLVEVFNIRKLFLEVLKSNNRAHSLYTKLGFQECGCLHKHFYINKCFDDVLIMEKIF
ncbi:MAG: GNAT family N-acetyltransferase [Methylomarinum sp.]|nr:GNAT family N-acetyltransferase [Methylomarinum sp.]